MGRCEPRGRGVRVTAPPFEGTQMIRQGATWPAKLGTPTGRRAIPDFRDPVTTLAVSVHAELQQLQYVPYGIPLPRAIAYSRFL